jgi:hypothetical protein
MEYSDRGGNMREGVRVMKKGVRIKRKGNVVMWAGEHGEEEGEGNMGMRNMRMGNKLGWKI